MLGSKVYIQELTRMHDMKLKGDSEFHLAIRAVFAVELNIWEWWAHKISGRNFQ